MKKDTKKKLEKLRAWFENHPGSIVAFSGGIDSTLLLFLARKYQGREGAIGVISDSESLKRKDFQLAREICEDYDIQLEVIKTKELYDDRYNQNPVDRCFFCKEHLYTDLQNVADKYPGFPVLNGTNADDHQDYRPGLKAAQIYAVASPLSDCGVTKDEVRELAQYFGLPNWDKPASPCLSSRIPYTHKVTRKKLVEIEEAENLLNEFGFANVRVRHYGKLGRVEVPLEELPRLKANEHEIKEKIRQIGFPEVEFDEEGMLSGKLNRDINKSGSV